MSNRPRQVDVAIYLPTFDGGGAERFFIRLANSLTRLGWSVMFVVNQDRGPLRALLDSGVSVLSLRARNSLVSVWKLRSFYLSYAPRHMISALLFNNLCAIIAKKLSFSSCHLVICQRNHLSSTLEGLSLYRRTILRALVEKCYHQADAITVVTQGAAEDLSRIACIPLERLHVIGNPAPEGAEVCQARAAPPPHRWFGKGFPVLLAMGRMVPQKDYPTMLKAFALAREKHANLRLIILGVGPELTNLENLAIQLNIKDCVDFVGFVSKRLEYVVNCDVYILSSKFEGFPNSLIEAIACGVPVISTDCAGGGPRQVLRVALEDKLVAVGDPRSLAQAIDRELCKPTRASVLSKIADKWAFDEIEEQFICLLRERNRTSRETCGS